VNLLEDNQPTDLEQMVGLSRRSFISAGALCGAAMFLGGNLLSRSVMAASVSAGTSTLRLRQHPSSTSRRDRAATGLQVFGTHQLGSAASQNGPAFDPSGKGTAKAQELQFGDNNDGMSLFTFPGDDAETPAARYGDQQRIHQLPLLVRSRQGPAIRRGCAQGFGQRRRFSDRSEERRSVEIRPGLQVQPAHSR
jgi:hypothetical protein